MAGIVAINAMNCRFAKVHNRKDAMEIIYKFNNGRGAVLCRKCLVIIDENISYDEAVIKWAGKDVCADCKKT